MKTKMTLNETKTLMIRYAESLFNRGLTPGASANISAQFESGFVVTPTNSCFGFLRPDELSVLDTEGNLIDGLPPSKEFKLHQALYNAKSKTACVLHLHSTWATALSCLKDLNEEDVIRPITPYLTMRLGPVARVPYFPPGDDRLVQAVASKASRHDGILMANHGPIVGAPSIEKAVFAMEELEESAKLAMLVPEDRAQHLSEEEIFHLQNAYRGRI